MSKEFVFLWMLFMHVLDDFKLQDGLLVNLKQKKFWQEKAPKEQYRFDYIVALLMHGISWSFMIMLPIAVVMGFNVGMSFVAVFAANAIIHAAVDDFKANKLKINLIADQAIHLMQIVATFVVLMR
jgi:hypothetical protein